jgi:hypothetical protein
MHLRSGKALNKMTKSVNTGASMSSQSLQSSSQAQITQTSTLAMDAIVPTALGGNHSHASFDGNGSNCSHNRSVTAQMTRPEMGTFVPPFIVGVTVSTSIHTSPNPQVRTRFDDRVINTQNSSRDQPYGMPTSMMTNLHNIPAFIENAHPFTPFNTHSPSCPSVFGRSALPTLTTESMMLFGQQMDESNHEVVNLLTQQIGTVFNHLIQTMNQGYQALATQMGRITNFFTPLQTVYQQIPRM